MTKFTNLSLIISVLSLNVALAKDESGADLAHITTCQMRLKQNSDSFNQEADKLGWWVIPDKRFLRKKATDFRKMANIVQAAKYLYYNTHSEELPSGVQLNNVIEADENPQQLIKEFNEYIMASFNTPKRFRRITEIRPKDRFELAQKIFYAIAEKKALCHYQYAQGTGQEKITSVYGLKIDYSRPPMEFFTSLVQEVDSTRNIGQYISFLTDRMSSTNSLHSQRPDSESAINDSPISSRKSALPQDVISILLGPDAQQSSI